MKKIFYILMIGLSFSCNSLLDVEPEILVSYDNFFKNEQDLEVTLYQLQDYVQSSLLDFHGQEDLGLIADDNWNQPYIWNWGDMIGSPKTDWAGIYQVVYMSNLLLENVYKAKDEVTPERIDFYKAQAYFGKALGYFFLSRRWGEVPITRNSSSSEVYGKKPLLEVIDTVIANAKKAYNMLPEQEGVVDRTGAQINSKQFGSKGAACALLAHAYAWKGSMIDLLELEGDSREAYVKSIEYSTHLINGEVGNYSLVRDPDHLCELFSDNTANNPEAIFEFTLDMQAEYILSVYLIGAGYIGYPLDLELSVDSHGDNVRYKISYKTIESMYDAQDLRPAAYFYEYEKYKDLALNKNGYVFPNKWRTGIYSTNPNSAGVLELIAIKSNFAYWRLSDFYLLRAECNVKIGENGLAETDLNEIRKVNNANAYPGSKGDERGLQYAIFHEREREFVMEGHRFYDIVRNGLEYINTLPGEQYPKFTKKDLKDGAIFLPIFETAFTLNDQLRQNVYWAQFIY